MNVKNLDNICMNCFSPMPEGAAFCTVCGHDQKSPPETEYRLPLRTILNGKYMVGQVLGEGGFGITYVGYDLNLDIKVAVKEYYPSGFVTRTATSSSTVQTYGGEQGEIFRRGRERFVDEARRLARFRTLRGIVMVNDFFVENGTAYIVMEFVEGVTLKSYMAQMGGKLPAAQVFDMLVPVFESLSQIHEGGIIHRDISPDNIMITPDGSVKLLDFGAAREFGIDEKSLSVMLKHGYAPIEQYTTRGEQGPHTDVYALAATIYKAITGVTPESSMDRVIDDILQPPSALGVALPPQQEAALMKGLAVRAEHRWQTVGELQAALGLNSQFTIHNAQLQGSGQAYSATPATPNVAPPPSVIAVSEPQSPTPIAPAPDTPPPPPAGAASGAPTPHVPTPPYAPPPPAKSKKPKIIAAAIAACIVVVGIVLALTLPGGGVRGRGYNAVAVERYVELFDASDWHDVVSIASGARHTVGLRKDGTVVATGSYEDGQCDVSDWRDIVAVYAGGWHTVGLRSDGTVVAVGNNEQGQCDVSDWRDISAISAGTYHTVGLRKDGTVVAVGTNVEFGFFGGNQCDVSDWRNIAEVSAGDWHTVGLRKDGTVVSTDERHDVSAWRNITAAYAGPHYTVGLRKDGTVVVAIPHGDLLAGIRAEMSPILEWSNITALACSDHIVGLKSDGTVVAVGITGSLDIGQCDVSDWRNITAICAVGGTMRQYYTVGLKSDGTVVTAGNAPGDVSAWRGVVAIAGNEAHIVALTTEGSSATGGDTRQDSISGNADNTPLAETPEAPPEPTPLPTPTPVPLSLAVAGDIIQFGDYDWRVLDVQNGRILVITDRVLEYRNYHDDHKRVTWETSDMRSYLNGTFYDSFSASDKARIADTNVVNEDNQWRDTPGGSNTTDKVFLLSLGEVVNYFGDSGQLANQPPDAWTIDDQYNDARIAQDKSGATSWWLRSPGSTDYHAALVGVDGNIYVSGMYTTLGTIDGGGVRPAMWLLLE